MKLRRSYHSLKPFTLASIIVISQNITKEIMPKIIILVFSQFETSSNEKKWILALLLTLKGREKEKGSQSETSLRTLLLMLFVINERKWGDDEQKMRSLLPCFHYTSWLLVTVRGNKCSKCSESFLFFRVVDRIVLFLWWSW